MASGSLDCLPRGSGGSRTRASALGSTRGASVAIEAKIAATRRDCPALRMPTSQVLLLTQAVAPTRIARSVRDACQSALGGEESLISRIAAGAVTGAIGSLAFNPVDVVRVRMQSASPPPSTFGAFGLVAAERAAYRGWHASAARASALSGSQLATYDTAKRVFKRHGWLTDEHGMETAALHSAASLLSGFVAQTVAQPFDTAKAILMADTSGRPAAEVLRDAIKSRGGLPRAAFAGYLPALARQGPVMLVQMPIVEGLRKLCGLDYF